MILTYEAGKWYTFDLIIDWEEQRVSIYIDGEAYSAQPFFLLRTLTADNANALAIYGLSPGSTSKFRNMQVCE
jgi:hypothetical protein